MVSACIKMAKALGRCCCATTCLPAWLQLSARRRLPDQAGEQSLAALGDDSAAAIQYYTLEPAEKRQRQGARPRQQLTEGSPDLLTNQAGSRQAVWADSGTTLGAASSTAATAGSTIEGAGWPAGWGLDGPGQPGGPMLATAGQQAGSGLEAAGQLRAQLQTLDSATSMHSALPDGLGDRRLPRRAVSELPPGKRAPAGPFVPLRQHELGSIRMAGLATGGHLTSTPACCGCLRPSPAVGSHESSSALCSLQET